MTEAGHEQQQSEPKFGVIAEVEGRPSALVLLNLPFGRLIDEVVVPYDNDEAFFVDGVPVTRKAIRRIKVVQLSERFLHGMRELERGLTLGEHQNRKVYGDQYTTRFEHVLRTNAYNQAVKPRIKDYIPRREELISAATTVFLEAMKTLSR